MPTFKTRNVNAAFMAVAVVLLNLAAGFWTYKNTLESREVYEQNAEVAAKNIALGVDTNLADLTNQIDLALQTSIDFMQDGLSRNGRLDGADVSLLLERQRSRLPALSALRASDAQGNILFGPSVGPRAASAWAGLPFFQGLAAGTDTGLVITDPVPGDLGLMATVMFARRYKAPDGRFAGVVVASVSISTLQVLLSKFEVGEHGTVALRDSRMALVAKAPPLRTPPNQLGATLISKELAEIARSGVRSQTYSTRTPTDGTERIFAFRRVHGTPFRVVVGLGRAEYLAKWRLDAFASLLYFLAFCGLSTMCCLFLLRAFAESERSALQKSQFLANMSHEIRTPLNAIIGMLTLVRGTRPSPSQQRYLDNMDAASRALLRILNDILDFSKLDADKMTIERSAFSLETTLRQLSGVLGASIPGPARVDLLFDIDAAVPSALVGDETRLLQVLLNLGGNAVKFTPRGQVLIRIALVHRWATRVRLSFSVCDSGIGIAKEDQARIFSGFSQAEASTTRRFGGTGLGLAISQRLIQLMGGTLQVQSAPGEGSSFSFELEFWLGEPAMQGPTAAVEAPPPGRALVVDDNPVALDTTARALASMGWQVSTASSADEALTLACGEEGPGCALLCVDASLGAAAVAALRSLCTLSKVSRGAMPVVLEMSSNAAPAAGAGLFGQMGAPHATLSRPFTPRMLAERIAQASGGAGAATPPDDRPRHRLAGLRILVVEDNQLNQQVAEELLVAEGARICLAPDGRAGVEAVRVAAPQFDVVLMDLQMPGMDGLSATRCIRAELQCGVPIIAMTANAAPADREACLAAGMNDHVGKPFDLEHLVAVTSFWAHGHGGTEAAAPAARAGAADVDVPTALSRLGGARTLFDQALEKFAQGLDGSFEALDGDVRAGRLEASIRMVHTLKGNAALLGANAVAAQAAALEREWKAAGTVGPHALAAVRSLRSSAMACVPRLRDGLGSVGCIQPQVT